MPIKNKKRSKDALAHIFCPSCKEWYDVSLDMMPSYCPLCGSAVRTMTCNRCGYNWRIRNHEDYPYACPNCKSPYYNRMRIHEYRKNDECQIQNQSDTAYIQ